MDVTHSSLYLSCETCTDVGDVVSGSFSRMFEEQVLLGEEDNYIAVKLPARNQKKEYFVLIF